jgi:hypothetical protein
MTTDLSLNCWLHGDAISKIFTVKISSKKKVSSLHKEINLKIGFATPVKNLLLWEASIEKKKIATSAAGIIKGETLDPLDKLSDIFEANGENDRVHVIVGELFQYYC